MTELPISADLIAERNALHAEALDEDYAALAEIDSKIDALKSG